MCDFVDNACGEDDDFKFLPSLNSEIDLESEYHGQDYGFGKENTATTPASASGMGALL